MVFLFHFIPAHSTAPAKIKLSVRKSSTNLIQHSHLETLLFIQPHKCCWCISKSGSRQKFCLQRTEFSGHTLFCYWLRKSMNTLYAWLGNTWYPVALLQRAESKESLYGRLQNCSQIFTLPCIHVLFLLTRCGEYCSNDVRFGCVTGLAGRMLVDRIQIKTWNVLV